MSVFSHLCQGLLSHNKCLYTWYSHVYIEKEFGSFASPNHNIYIAADRIPVDFGSQAHPSSSEILKKMSPKILDSAQQTQNICIKFVQRLPNVFDVGPKL